MSTMQRLGLAWYRRLLRLLPSWLRAESGREMLRAFAEAQTEVVQRRGVPGLLAFWVREAAGLVRAAWRARHPAHWARRTRPSPEQPNPLHRPTMDNLRSDLAFAFRSFGRRPGLFFVAVVTLCLGIGSSTAMFSVIDSVLLRPLDYPEPDQIHAVYPSWPELQSHPTLGDLAMRGTWSWPELWLVAEQQEVFERFAGYASAEVTLHADEGRPERIPVGVASPQLLPMLGADTRLGRLFDETDGAGGADVVLLAFETWRDRFGGDPDVIGRTLLINDRGREVVGVLGEGFELVGVEARVWLPRAGSSTDPGMGNHGRTRALGRLAEGVTPDQARDEVARILGSLPPSHGLHGATVEPLHAELTRDVRPVLLVMLASAGLLLLVSCGNVAAILLGAGIDREQELAVRGAIGASRSRIAQQLLTESAILALAGALGGVAVASLTTRALTFLAPPGVPRIADVSVDAWVLTFAVGLSALCGIVFGLVPAISLSSTDLAGAMGSASRTSGGKRARLQSTVVVGELALATILIVGGLLLTRTVMALDRVDPGFDHEGLVALSMALSSERFQTGDGEVDAAAFRGHERQIIEEVASLPQVEDVHSSSAPPFFNRRGNNPVLPEGWADPDNPPVAERRFVTPGFLDFLGIPLLEGRDLEPADFDEGAEPVVVVSRGLAELAWPGESAVGRTLDHWATGARVVGVAADVRDERLEGTTELAYYAPNTPFVGPGQPLLIRVAGDPGAAIASVRDRIWSVDPDIPITRVATMEELMGDRISDQVYRARLMAVFAGLAGVFALLGIYGVTSRSVARRTREMGLRVALGADRGRVRSLVTFQAVRLAAYGVFGGIVATLAVGGVLERFLWGVTRTDPVTLVAVGLGLPLLAALAALPPARRATRVDPLVALRAE